MVRIESMRERVRAIWRDAPGADVSLCILDAMAKLAPQQLRLLTFQDMAAFARKAIPDADLFAAVSILVAHDVSALEPHALFIDDEDAEFEMSAEDVADARQTGVLIHPLTGMPVENFEDKIFPFFAATKKFVNIVRP